MPLPTIRARDHLGRGWFGSAVYRLGSGFFGGGLVLRNATLAGMRPRSLTAMPWSFVHIRIRRCAHGRCLQVIRSEEWSTDCTPNGTSTYESGSSSCRIGRRAVRASVDCLGIRPVRRLRKPTYA
jgi:hypothetical protein